MGPISIDVRLDTLVYPFVQEWLSDLERQGKSLRTLAAYCRALAHFARWSESAYGIPFAPAAFLA